MEPQAMRLEYKVGIFVGIGLIILMASILMVGGKKMFLTRYVHLKTRFTEVQGLFPGSIVSLAGMPVGNVEDITFVSSENKLELDMKIDSKYESRLVDGISAEIRTQGALGDKYVYLSPGISGAKPLAEGSVLPSTETDHMKLLTDRQDGVASIIDVIKELKILITSLNADGRTARVMGNLAESTEKMKKTLDQLDALLGDIRGEIPHDKKLQKAMVSLSSILEKIDDGKGSLGQIINDPSLHQSLKALLGGSARNRYMKDMLRETIQQNESTPAKK